MAKSKKRREPDNLALLAEVNRTPTKPRMVVVSSDHHFPEVDRALWNGFLQFLRDTEPDECLLLGDFMEMASVSSHGGDPNPPSFLDDIAAGNAALDELQEVFKGTTTFVAGNHDVRADRYICENAVALNGAISIPDLLRMKERGIEYHPYGAFIQRGKMHFTHGWLTGALPSKQHMDKVGTSITHGHCHRPSLVTKAVLGGKLQAGMSLPCMRTLEVDWMKGLTGWCGGFAVFYIEPCGTYYPYLVLAQQSAFVWNGVRYGG